MPGPRSIPQPKVWGEQEQRAALRSRHARIPTKGSDDHMDATEKWSQRGLESHDIVEVTGDLEKWFCAVQGAKLQEGGQGAGGEGRCRELWEF